MHNGKKEAFGTEIVNIRFELRQAEKGRLLVPKVWIYVPSYVKQKWEGFWYRKCEDIYGVTSSKIGEAFGTAGVTISTESRLMVMISCGEMTNWQRLRCTSCALPRKLEIRLLESSHDP